MVFKTLIEPEINYLQSIRGTMVRLSKMDNQIKMKCKSEEVIDARQCCKVFIVWQPQPKACCVGILGITIMNLDNVNTQDTH